MPGHYPGPLGLAAFSAIKFAGYCAAGATLRRVYPETKVKVLTIGVTRTVVGFAAGIANITFWAALAAGSAEGDPRLPFFFSLLLLRLLIWSVMIWYFYDQPLERPGRLLVCIVAGMGLSFLLDVIGIGLAFVTPGQIPVC